MNDRTPARIAFILLAALGACTVLPPREDATRYFVLSASAPANAESSSDKGLRVSVGPVRLPDYLLRPEIVRRAGENQIDPSPIDRWAEPIDHAIERVLCLDLAAAMPKSTVVSYPAPPSDDVDLHVEVDFAGFEGTHTGAALLDARWTVRDYRNGNRIVRATKLERASESDETRSVVASMSALIGALAADIAREVGSLTK
jgi:uncharacterized lipoprotein YmbA